MALVTQHLEPPSGFLHPHDISNGMDGDEFEIQCSGVFCCHKQVDEFFQAREWLRLLNRRIHCLGQLVFGRASSI
ncbi:MAG: hypothetical protein SF066_13880 [Thermoanaerobaculia bacterium]|nr:hypothetical protein [Thermoanaerobaculia bacterium]